MKLLSFPTKSFIKKIKQRLNLFASVKIDIEKICFGGLLFLVAYTILIIPSIIQIYYFYEQIGLGYNLMYYLFLIPGYLFSRYLSYFSYTVLTELMKPYLVDEPLKEGETHKERTRKLGNYIYGTIYYTLSFSILFVLAAFTDFLPNEFGGRLNMGKACSSWPYKVPFSLQIFYMITLGHHIERTVYEFKENKKAGNFFTMIFHHFVTILLISLSFFNMHVKFGVPILLTHDFCDIFLNGGKAVKSVWPKNATNGFYIALLISWTYCRVYMFLTNIVQGVYSCLKEPQGWMNRFFFLHVIYIPGLISLLGLNLFWLYQIINIGYLRLFKKDYTLAYYDKKTDKQSKN